IRACERETTRKSAELGRLCRVTGHIHFHSCCVNVIDRLIQGGSPCSQPHRIKTVKPFGPKVRGPLYLETGKSGPFPQGSQLTCVVRVLSSHYHQRLHF